jgi:hypothetical protein
LGNSVVRVPGVDEVPAVADERGVELVQRGLLIGVLLQITLENLNRRRPVCPPDAVETR